MNRCNVDFFDRNLVNTHHDTITAPAIDDDYLAPETNSIYIGYTDKVVESGFIHISGELDFFGVVTKVSDDSKVTQVDYKPFISLFDHDVLFDTDLQNGSKTLENTIGDLIKQYWISSGDPVQNIPSLSVNPISETKNWGFNIKSDKEEMHHAIVGFHNVLLKNALTKYQVSIRAHADLAAKSIRLDIGSTPDTIVVEADLPSVEIKTFTINELQETTNKLEIWNGDNYTERTIYYVHPDGSYDTSNANRIEPVVMDVIAADPETETIREDLYYGYYTGTGTIHDSTASVYTEPFPIYPNGKILIRGTYPTPKSGWVALALYDSSMKFTTRVTLLNEVPNTSVVDLEYQLPSTVHYVGVTYSAYDEFAPDIIIKESFASTAQKQASDKLSGISLKNLIELVIKNSKMIPLLSEMPIGQTVYISHEGMMYPSILTGKKLEAGLAELIFGTVRTELTKKLVLGG